jgi:hypothetical protein
VADFACGNEGTHDLKEHATGTSRPLDSSGWPVFTEAILVAAILRFSSNLRINWARLAMATSVFMVLWFTIETTRFVAEQEGGLSLGPEGAWSVLKEGAASVTGYSGQVAIGTSERGSLTPQFLSMLIDRVGEGQHYIYGKVMLHQLTILIPRALWPAKPEFESVQIEIKRAFGVPLGDDAPGALVSYFAFGGPIAVFLWLFLFGFFLAKIQGWVKRSNSLLAWFVLIWTLSGVTYMDSDQLVAIVLELRHCLLAYLAFRLINALISAWEEGRGAARGWRPARSQSE